MNELIENISCKTIFVLTITVINGTNSYCGANIEYNKYPSVEMIKQIVSEIIISTEKETNHNSEFISSVHSKFVLKQKP